MTEKRFTYGMRQGSTQYEIKDSLHEFPTVEPYYYESSAKKVCKFLNELNDENTHIKNTIQEAYKTERTQIGKNTLKQLLESING